MFTDGGVKALKGQIVFALDKENVGLIQELLGCLRSFCVDILHREHDREQREEMMKPHACCCSLRYVGIWRCTVEQARLSMEGGV